MKSLTISRKIGIGFIAIILITGTLGGLAVSSMRSVQNAARTLATEFVPEVDISGSIQNDLSATQLAIRSYGFTAEPNYLLDARRNLVKVKSDIQAGRRLAEEHPNLVRLRADLGQFETGLKIYEQAINATEERNIDLSKSREKMNAAAIGFMTNIDKLIESQNEKLQNEIKAAKEPASLAQRVHKLNLAYSIRGLCNEARIAVFKAQVLRESAIFQESLRKFELMQADFSELRGFLRVTSDIEELDAVKQEAANYQQAVRAVMADTLALTEIGHQRLEAAGKIATVTADIFDAGMKRTVQAAHTSDQILSSSSLNTIIGVGASLLVGAAIALSIIRSTTQVLTSIADRLSESSAYVTEAAAQVAEASQALAQGSSEQAASLEETSASLEEMSSMTKRNAEGAQQTKEFSNLTKTSADAGAEHMQEMRQAMAAIKASSDDIGKIINSIDEIAFQTNILALNAAVEAARAGEAGMGFAVVAEEVRNLAQRSAHSAKETAGKIEDAIRKSEQGVVISAKMAGALTDILEKAKQVDMLVAEIAGASSEQSQGINHVNIAVSQMDKITQGNAASAEESAAAAEMLSSQAVAMEQTVADLRQLVTSKSVSDASKRRPAAKQTPQTSRALANRLQNNLRRPTRHSGTAPGFSSNASALDAHFSN